VVLPGTGITLQFLSEIKEVPYELLVARLVRSAGEGSAAMGAGSGPFPAHPARVLWIGPDQASEALAVLAQ
jgi:2'-5' RNA ligase